MKRKSEHYIEDVLTSIIKIKSFVKDISINEFLLDEKTQFAVVRAFEIIGEATKKIPDEIKSKHSGIPWRDITGMRDILAHDYIDVDYRTIWETIQSDLPLIEKIFNELLKEADNENSIF